MKATGWCMSSCRTQLADKRGDSVIEHCCDCILIRRRCEKVDFVNKRYGAIIPGVVDVV